MPEVEPGRVGARYEQIYHGPVTSVQHVSPEAAGAEGRHGVEDSRDCKEAGEDSAVHPGSVELGGTSGRADHEVTQPEGGEHQHLHRQQSRQSVVIR